MEQERDGLKREPERDMKLREGITQQRVPLLGREQRGSPPPWISPSEITGSIQILWLSNTPSFDTKSCSVKDGLCFINIRLYHIVVPLLESKKYTLLRVNMLFIL